MIYVWLGIILVLDIAATLLARKYSMTHQPLWLLTSCLIYGGAMWPFGELMKQMPMSIANVLWIVFSIIALTAIDIAFFNEVFTVWQLIGFVVIIIGLVLVHFWK